MKTDQELSVLARRIRQARQEMPPVGHDTRNSQEALAGRLGVHWVTVSKWERDKSIPVIANLVAIAEATGKPLSFFTDDMEQTAEAADEEDAEMAADLLEMVKMVRRIDHNMSRRRSREQVAS